jgi:hypothetical protein
MKSDDDDGRYSLLGGRSSPGSLSAQGPIYNQFQNFLYDSDVCNATKDMVNALRKRLEDMGCRLDRLSGMPVSNGSQVFDKVPRDWEAE